MILFPHYQILSDHLINLQLPLSLLEDIINQYSVSYVMKEKLYKLSNVSILSNSDTGQLRFYKRKNEEIHQTENGVVYSYDEYPVQPFSFYDCDYSEEYDLYQNDTKTVQLKVYDSYFIVEKYI